jgi:hypothetical protein
MSNSNLDSMIEVYNNLSLAEKAEFLKKITKQDVFIEGTTELPNGKICVTKADRKFIEKIGRFWIHSNDYDSIIENR